MRVGEKITLNTLVLYAKLLISIVVTLFSTRIILSSLGVEDFGLYNLIGGAIAFLSFLNSAMMVSTQRFLSVGMGKKKAYDLHEVFSTSLAIHLIIGTILLIILFLIRPLLFSSILSIPHDRISVAMDCYVIMIFSVYITILAVPFNASINAHEDMWYFAIVETIVTFLKLGAAFILYYVMSDKLIMYCYLLLVITVIGILAKLIWAFIKYDEVNVNVIKYFNYRYFRSMTAFISWNALGSVAQIGRNQGVAIVLNMFFGVVVNAAYAITNQVNSFLIYFSQILTSTFAPQIMKSKGDGNNRRMIFISILSSKLSFFLTAFMAIFVLTDLPLLLHIWLDKVPNDTLEFCNYSVWIFLIMQIYPGLVRMIQANGNIRNYQISTSVLLILTLPVGYFIFKLGAEAENIFSIMIFIQLMVMITTLYFSKKLCALNVRKFILESIVLPLILFISILIISKYIYNMISIHQFYMLVIVGLCGNIILGLFYYFIVFDRSEKQTVLKVIKNLMRKNHEY